MLLLSYILNRGNLMSLGEFYVTSCYGSMVVLIWIVCGREFSCKFFIFICRFWPYYEASSWNLCMVDVVDCIGTRVGLSS